jgi:kynurenine formamidase
MSSIAEIRRSAPTNRSRTRPSSLPRKLSIADIHAAAERLRNWGKWGPDDEIGTLNYVTADDIVAAARLVRKGKVISLGLPYDRNGPQAANAAGPGARFNPIHVMLRAGTDAYSGALDSRKIRSADDMIIMPTQCGTQWDGLGHVFYGDKMWNGRDCRTVNSFGAQQCGIEKTRDRMVGRGVLLDIARMLGLKRLPDGFGVTPDLLDEAERELKVSVRRGDFLLVRTGHLEAQLAAGSWDGYAGGDAPGLTFETLDWLHARRVAGIVTDTWGVEVRPNQTADANQPWHWIAIPIIGLSVGEIFNLAELSEDCAEDGRYEFMFVAPALPITGAVGSPVNPLAIK